MPIFNWTLEPKEEDCEEYLLGRRIHTSPYTRYWYAGGGLDGERRWVKSKRDAMTFPTVESARETWHSLSIDSDHFITTSN